MPWASTWDVEQGRAPPDWMPSASIALNAAQRELLQDQEGEVYVPGIAD